MIGAGPVLIVVVLPATIEPWKRAFVFWEKIPPTPMPVPGTRVVARERHAAQRGWLAGVVDHPDPAAVAGGVEAMVESVIVTAAAEVWPCT